MYLLTFKNGMVEYGKTIRTELSDSILEDFLEEAVPSSVKFEDIEKAAFWAGENWQQGAWRKATVRVLGGLMTIEELGDY